MFILVVIFFAIALLAYLGILFGKTIESSLGGAAFLARFISFLSEGITVLSPFITGLLLGLVGMSLGSKYGQEAILRNNVTTGRIFTGIVSAIGGAIFIYAIGSALNWLYQFDEPQLWTIYPALIAAAIMLVVGLSINPKRQFPIGLTIYTALRSLLNFIRSIEPLIYVIVFAVWVGIGPFAGVLALTIHTIAALGKLFSEQVESISEGPIEAITATGANRIQMVVFAVIPQIVPPFIAFTLYRWDINVRFSTVIGFAGGGGIGFVLIQNINLLNYRQASVMMIAIAVVVISLDYLSSKIRTRII
ncbi:MAG: ABC transporter permease subunit [Chloroflexi bacterium]|nr:ABC transporter permease subunit [Chloroflexota bacterium]